MQDQLADFLRARKEQSTGPTIDWQAKRDAWVKSVKFLYKSIEELLRDAIAAKDVAVRTFTVNITEDFIGEYSIPALELTIGNERVEFRPKGVTVLGAQGRVDMRGERDTVTLLREEAKAGGWAVVLQRIPTLTIVPLDRDSLKYALEKVMLPLS